MKKQKDYITFVMGLWFLLKGFIKLLMGLWFLLWLTGVIGVVWVISHFAAKFW